MVQARPTHRRVLQVHTGEVSQFLDKAQAEDFPEIEERDDVPEGTSVEFITPVSQAAPTDWPALFAAAPTALDKIRVIARMLHLEP